MRPVIGPGLDLSHLRPRCHRSVFADRVTLHLTTSDPAKFVSFVLTAADIAEMTREMATIGTVITDDRDEDGDTIDEPTPLVVELEGTPGSVIPLADQDEAA